MDADGFAGLGRGRHDRFCGKVEGDAEDIGIFDIEQSLVIQFIGKRPV
jgi:hypothetical protein